MPLDPATVSAQLARMPDPGNVVHVSLHPDVYFSLDKFQAIQKSILERLGCRACTSGWDIRWGLQQRFLVDEKLGIHEIGG
jgi:hypothetical protein